MQPGLFLLLLMGQCSFSTCHRYEYHFINEWKTWNEAQLYCREKYTDLATVYNMTDMKRLQNSAGGSAGAWIGLNSKRGGEKKWHWSQPGEVYSENTEKWKQGEPNDKGGHENCVRMFGNKWVDVPCSWKHGFICYDGDSSENFHWIKEDKTWTEAQSYCREHHTDLVSGDQLETLQIWQSLWIGLFRDTWLWSDGSSSSFRHWESFQSGQEQNKCAFLVGSGKWDSADCSESRSFFCYEGQCSFSIICQYHLIDDKKTWYEAQSYCREKFTDLATVYDMTDMNRLQNSAGGSAGAWIGLNSSGGGEKKWHWSQPGEVYSENPAKWKQGKPNDAGGHENCVRMRPDQKWTNLKCDVKNGFICYDENSSYFFSYWSLSWTWTEAQSYCREHHTDLVSGDQLETLQIWGLLWIGLFRDTWLWSDGSNSSFRHWESFQSGQEQNKCAFLQGSGKWDSADCSERKTFFCYEVTENMILIQQNLTWDQAVDYCREHHHDLVSITDPEQQRSAERRAKKASTPYVWLGLRNSCVLGFWFWVSDNLVCYDNWAEEMDHDECCHCAAMEKGGNHKWFKRDEIDMYNFICVL